MSRGEILTDKTQCLRNNQVVIKTSKDLQDVFNYVDTAYGKDFCVQYKKNYGKDSKD